MLSVSFQLVSLLLAASGVRAGTSSATCMSGTTWLDSESGLDPCVLWAEMRSVCDSSSGSNVNALSGSGNVYPAPTSSSSTVDCDCNADAYNLMASCSFCQGTSNDWLGVNDWSAGCTDYSSYWDFSPGYSKNLTAAEEINVDIPLVDYGYRPSTLWNPFDACLESTDEADCIDSTSSWSSSSSSSSSKPSGPMSGGDDNSIGVAVAVADLTVLYIVLAIVLALPALSSLIALIVCCVRQNNRRRFYQPLAEYYRNGGVPPGSAWSSTAPILAYKEPGYA